MKIKFKTETNERTEKKMNAFNKTHYEQKKRIYCTVEMKSMGNYSGQFLKMPRIHTHIGDLCPETLIHSQTKHTKQRKSFDSTEIFPPIK